MSILEEYEKKCGLTPIDAESILFEVEAAEGKLRDEVSSTRNFSDLPTYNRVIVWLHDRLQAVYAALENPKAPTGVSFRCAYCWNAAGRTEEAWQALPKVDYDDACLHAQVCEHNPLVQSIARISHDRDAALAQVADLQGRKLGSGDAWAEAASEATGMYDYQRKLHEAMKATIRSLLSTELPAGDLRKAIGELVR